MKRFIFCLCLLVTLGSCASFKEVNSFATNSAKSINSYKNIAYTFSGNCNFKCTQRALENPFFQLVQNNCDCDEAVLADKNINRVLRVLSSYFKGVASLSNNKLTTYSFDAIEKPLVEGKYLKKATLKPYTSLTGLITTMLADNYRSKKLKQVIETANPDVVLLLEKMAAIIENNLLPTLLTRQSDLEQIYHDLYADPGTSSYEKFSIQKSYFLELSIIELKKDALKKYSNSLIKISKGHSALYNNKDKLKEKDVRKIIHQYSVELNAFVAQIKK